MARLVKIKKIEFNHTTKNYEYFEVTEGSNESSIRECQHIDKSFYRVDFKDGSFQDIFNVERVYWVGDE